MSELKHMAPLSKHPNIVQLIGGCWEDGPDKLGIVLEYCIHGSLSDLLAAGEAEDTWEETYYGMVLGIAKGMKYLHLSLIHI